MTDKAQDIPTLTEIVDAGEFLLNAIPPPNTHIHFGDFPGDVIYNFHRDKPFTRFQVWMIHWCFGWRVEQEHSTQEPAVHGD